MFDIRKLIGRVYPVVQRFADYAGRSTGSSPLTPQDIAAAVGMLDYPVGKEIFLYLWWREACDEKQLRSDLSTALFNEWSLRELKLALLSCDLAAAKKDKDQQRVAMLSPTVSAARRSCWPRCRWMYRRVVDVVLADISHNEICSACLGEYTDCEKCAGHGVLKFSVTRRAELLGVCRATYRTSWHEPYDWLFKLCVRSEKKAAAIIAKRLLNVG